MGWSVAGIVLGLLAIISGSILGIGGISPFTILCGLAGILLGVLGMPLGSRKLGVAALVAGGLGLVLGLVLLALVMASLANRA